MGIKSQMPVPPGRMRFIQLTFPECFTLLLSLAVIWAELCEVLVSRTSAGRRQGYCIINVGINLWIHPFVIILSSPAEGCVRNFDQVWLEPE